MKNTLIPLLLMAILKLGTSNINTDGVHEATIENVIPNQLQRSTVRTVNQTKQQNRSISCWTIELFSKKRSISFHFINSLRSQLTIYRYQMKSLCVHSPLKTKHLPLQMRNVHQPVSIVQLLTPINYRQIYRVKVNKYRETLEHGCIFFAFTLVQSACCSCYNFNERVNERICPFNAIFCYSFLIYYFNEASKIYIR